MTIFLSFQNLACKSSNGFRPLHSTSMAILELVKNICKGFEKNEFTIGIFLDLKKAFDTVNLEIFIKLNYYGIRDIPLAWLAS